MNIRLIQIGKTTMPFMAEGEAEYLKRLRRFVKIESVVIPDIKAGKRSEGELKRLEGKQILDVINEGEFVVLLDERGKLFRSVELAEWFQRKMNQGTVKLCFVVGGPYGFDEAVLQRANQKISLSPLTFSHQMVRMFFLEQVYRAMSILNNQPYHHE